jgi:toxin ParE1/3/4
MPKPKYQINITEAAEKDLGDIIDYISADNLTAAFKVAVRIEKNILKLENFPFIGVVPRIRRLALKGYRILIMDDYLIFYVIAGKETIEIRRILSSKRNYQFLFS